MKKLFFVLLAGASLFACNRENGKSIAANAIKEPPIPEMDYETFKSSVLEHKAGLAGHPHNEVSEYFFKLVNDNIYAYWQGTPWEFYGMTRTPQKGTIACGYFVTNTLADLGLKIERIKLAQCASGEMIKILCTDIHTFSQFKKLQSFLDTQPVNSVFIIGLDYHTGYVVKDTTGSYFLHSNYINNQGVMKEKIETSRALVNNKIFMIGSLTGNRKLLEKWVTEK